MHGLQHATTLLTSGTTRRCEAGEVHSPAFVSVSRPRREDLRRLDGVVVTLPVLLDGAPQDAAQWDATAFMSPEPLRGVAVP